MDNNKGVGNRGGRWGGLEWWGGSGGRQKTVLEQQIIWDLFYLTKLITKGKIRKDVGKEAMVFKAFTELLDTYLTFNNLSKL